MCKLLPEVLPVAWLVGCRRQWEQTITGLVVYPAQCCHCPGCKIGLQDTFLFSVLVLGGKALKFDLKMMGTATVINVLMSLVDTSVVQFWVVLCGSGAQMSFILWHLRKAVVFMFGGVNWVKYSSNTAHCFVQEEKIFGGYFFTRVQYRSCAEQCELSGVQQWSCLLCAGGGGRTEGRHPQQLSSDSQEGAHPHLAAPAGHWGAQGTAGEPQWYEGQWCWFTLLFFFFSCVSLLLPDCSNQPW